MIWLVAGGSGGHLLPAVSMFYFLKNKGIEVKLFYEEKLSITNLLSRFVGVEKVAFPALPNIRKRPVDFLLFQKKLNGFFSREETVKRPRAVVCFGGYQSFFPAFWAGMRNIPVFLHEQNAKMGLANSVLSGFARDVFFGIRPSSLPFYMEKKVVLTGNFFALPEEMEYIREEARLPGNIRKWVLVVGGSQGARPLNRAIPEISKSWPADIGIVHLCGLKDLIFVKEEYLKQERVVIVLDFFAPLWPLYEKIDLMIARAGAMTTTEACYFGVPTVFVPYPYAGGHQQANVARLLEDCACRVVSQNNKFWVENLGKQVITLLENDSERIEMGKRAKGAFLWDTKGLLSRLEGLL